MKTHSLQRALSRSIVAVALVLSIGGGSIAALSAFFSARDLQDQMLESIAGLVRTDRVAPSVLSEDDDDHDEDEDEDEENIVVRHLAARATKRRPHFNKAVDDGLQTVHSDDELWRVWVTTAGNGERFAIAQQTSVRDKVALSTGAYVLLPIILMALVLLLAIPLLVRRQLAPLVKLSNEIDALPGDKLPNLDRTNLPGELQPFVTAISGLFQRSHEVLDRQRRFVADAAHELRTPVAALTVLSENVASAHSESERIKRQTQVQRGLDRLQRLVNRLLDLARLQSRADENRQSVRFDVVVRGVVADLQPLAQQNGVDVGLIRDDGGQITDINESLSQLVRNAIENAITHSPANSEVDISITRSGNRVALTIEDRGSGIAAEDLPHVMEPFYRSVSNTAPGSGLGLAICQEIAEQLGGSILLENRDGGGLRFRYEQPSVQGS